MRILQVIPALPKGGAEKVLVELSNALAEDGHEVTVLLAYPVDPKLNTQSLNNRINLIYISKSHHRKIVRYFEMLVWILSHWSQIRRYDVIHCHLTYGLVFGSVIHLMRQFTFSSKPRIIATCHMIGMRGGIETFNQIVSRFFDKFVLIANDANWRLFQTQKNALNLRTIPNGISTDRKSTRLNSSH